LQTGNHRHWEANFAELPKKSKGKGQEFLKKAQKSPGGGNAAQVDAGLSGAARNTALPRRVCRLVTRSLCQLVILLPFLPILP
jgi:hypothetical protein